MATAKKAPAKKTPAKVTKKPGPGVKAQSQKASPTHKAATVNANKPAPRNAPKTQKTTVKKSAAPARSAASAPAKRAAAATTPASQQTPVKKSAPTKKAASSGPPVTEIPAVKGVTKDGIAYTKDFDVKFLSAQRALLLSERAALTGQATRLEDEANSLIEEQEMGDVQFDDEGGEGDTMVVERERDLTLSAAARQTIADIEAALGRLATGSYGYSTESGRPIPRERLEAIPWATMLVEEKVGGIGRR